jgi:exonuclease 3'-5' domain-containing protein 1
VVSSAQQLKTLATIIYDVDVCGVSLEGENVCRHGKVSWILISAKKTLVPIDVIALSQEAPTVWDTLKKCIFENKKLVKIFHDCRPAADYLFHKHGIKLINVFDTQVADAFIVRNTTGFHPSELRSLPNVLQLYNARIPSEELDYIRKFDQLEDKENSPWMVRPLPDRAHLKYGALKVKHLVPLRDNEIKKLLEKFTRAVSSQSEAYNQSDSLYQAQAENPLALPEALETILDEDMVESG